MEDQQDKAERLVQRGIQLADSGRLAEAIGPLSEGVSLYSLHGTRTEHADALRELAHLNVGSGDLAEGIRLLQRAHRILGSESAGRLHALVSLDLGKFLTRQGRKNEAEPYARAALAIFRDRNLGDWIAHALIALGDCSEPATASGCFSKALEIRQRESDWEAAAVALNRLGSLAHEVRDLVGALDYFARAVELLRNANVSHELANSLNLQGLVLRELGQVADALEAHCQADELQQFEGEPTASSLNNIALCLEELGRVDEAVSYLEASVKKLEQEDEQELLATSLDNLGDLYSIRGDVERADDCVRRAERIRRDRPL